ncbi:dolichyl-diphosphooligosaccharide-protein glycotransferase [Mycena olivaceomarginata]|nr:dolichyl-diphosphooligosaccharide-protein glycotransferase [Mycena olivaceomarginata]
MLLLSFLALVSLSVSRTVTSSTVHQQLVALAATGGGVIRLNSTSFDLITAANRNWSTSIVFTSLDPRNSCEPCKGFAPSWTAVAKAWSKVPQAHRDSHFFGLVDFVDSPRVIRKLGLQDAPTVYNYPPTEGPRATRKSDYWKYDFSAHGWKPQPLAEELSKATPVPIPYSTPFAWDRWATIGAGVIALGVALRLGNGMTILLSIWPWAISTIFLSLVMTSGYMFTRIRESPWMGRDGGWVAPAPQNQFGREVQMVFAIYGTLAFSFVMLIMVVPRQRSALVQRVQVYGLTATIVIVYSVLIVFYKVKMRGYPFRLLL